VITPFSKLSKVEISEMESEVVKPLKSNGGLKLSNGGKVTEKKVNGGNNKRRNRKEMEESGVKTNMKLEAYFGMKSTRKKVRTNSK
jgi:hypothetical protein